MRLSLKAVSGITLSLFFISLIVFFQTNRRGTGIVEGTEVFPGLDVNKVARVKIKIPQKSSVTLSRMNDTFVASDLYNLPIDNTKINNILFDISNMQIKEEVASSAAKDELDRFELSEGKFKYHVKLFDKNDTELVSFVVGKNVKGKGNYILKNNSILLSRAAIYYDSDIKDFLNKKITNIPLEKVENFNYAGKKTYQAIKSGDKFSIDGKDVESEKNKKILDSLKKVTSADLKEVFTAQDPLVAGVNFVSELKIQLKNKLVYHFSLGSTKENHYLRVRAIASEVPTQVSISTETDTEEIKLIEEMANAKKFAEQFNITKGNLVFETTEKLFDLLDL